MSASATENHRRFAGRQQPQHGADGFSQRGLLLIGTKTGGGHPIERAGLTHGSFFGLTISVDGQPFTEESDPFGLGNATQGYISKGRFGLHDLGDVSALSAAQIETASITAGVARLQRCEDGAWDPRDKRNDDFYFVTAASANNNCRLGDGWFLLDVQAHKASTDAELVEGGQLLALFVDPGVGLVCHDGRRKDDDDDDDRERERRRR